MSLPDERSGRVRRGGRRGLHPAWAVAAVTFLALIGAAGFRAAPGALMVPLNDEFGWSTSVMSLAVSINLVLYGLTAPFAAALMDRFGVRQVVAAALSLVALGAGGSVFMTASWQLLLFWGLLIGLGTGAMALVLAATVTNRWFHTRRGLVMGVLTAGSATGQLVFLPVVAHLAESSGWRSASLAVAGAALLVVPVVWLVMRDRPEDRGVRPYGADETYAAPLPASGGATRRALGGLVFAVRHRSFWGLAVAFAICGATTNGLIGIHFIPSAHDHGMSTTTAAGLLAAVGVFDIAGTVASGWLTDKYDPRKLLAGYYVFRGAGLVSLPWLLSDSVHPGMVVFIVLYGLDWVATVPPTAVLCRQLFGDHGTIVFGWVFASHQLGAAVAALGAGLIRDAFGTYMYAWWGGAALCAVAAALSVGVRSGSEEREPVRIRPRAVDPAGNAEEDGAKRA
nr:MFS transporter [Streptomyces sp. NBRC 109706]